MPLKLPKLHNIYFVLRHGRSLANEEGIILSNSLDGISGYGLTDEGKSEVRNSSEEAKTKNILEFK